MQAASFSTSRFNEMEHRVTTSVLDTPRGGERQRVAFTVVVVLSALFFLVLLGSAFAVFSPWLAGGGDGPPPGYDDPASHRWHDAQWAAHTGILLGGSLLALLWRPLSKPLLIQFLALATVVLAVMTAIGGAPENAIVLVPVALVIALYPGRRALLDLSRTDGFYLPVLALAVVAALVMAPDAWDKLWLQLDAASGDEHAEHSHWIGSTLLTINLLVAGVLMATRRPGWRALGVLLGLAFIYLGGTALTARDYLEGVAAIGQWSTVAGVLALLVGAGYLGLALASDRLSVITPRPVGRPRSAG